MHARFVDTNGREYTTEECHDLDSLFPIKNVWMDPASVRGEPVMGGGPEYVVVSKAHIVSAWWEDD